MFINVYEHTYSMVDIWFKNENRHKHLDSIRLSTFLLQTYINIYKCYWLKYNVYWGL